MPSMDRLLQASPYKCRSARDWHGMAFGKAKWAGRVAELRLPRPRLLEIATLDTATSESSLLSAYTEGRRLLADTAVHFVTRWEGVMAYSQQLVSYSKVLATHVRSSPW
jgi:hypothetical protein